MALFKGKASKHPQTKNGDGLINTTVRSFDGGWNVIDTDLNMKPTFAKTLDNMERGLDGTLSLRHGTKLFGTLATAGDTSAIINGYYFNAAAIIVQASGRISVVNGLGNVTASYTLWGATTYASFTVFNSQLIICNGANKPLIMEGNPNKTNYMVIIFLIDLGSVSNVNTPVGKYVVAHSQYTIIAGISAAPSSLSISAKGTSGTYPGDPAPNDAILLDLGPRVSVGSSVVTGLVSYRDKLLVTFERGVLLLTLGVYTGSPGVHQPSDDGFIEEFGCQAHRSLVSVGDDTFYLDNIGVNSVQRVVLFNTLRPQRASQLIDPEITKLIAGLTLAQINKYIFGVYDLRFKRYMVFIPTFDTSGNLTETIGFSYTNVPVLKVEAWARLRGWKWNCGFRTTQQNVIFCQDNKLYTYDFDNSDSNADYVGDVIYNPDGTGLPIAFDWELPWTDFNKRMNVKETRYLSMDSVGRAQFTLSMYVDNLRTDRNGTDSPQLSAPMVAGSSGGYGAQYYGNSPYGGGRPTGDERLFAWPASFKLAKLRVTGSSKLPLKIISITLAYKRGSIRGM